MLNWISLGLALALVALGSLTAVSCPVWLPWRLTVLAGEFGHWLAAAPLCLGVFAACSRQPGRVVPLVTFAVCVGALALLLKPTWQAWRIGTSVAAQLKQQLGPADIARAPFSMSGFAAADPAPVPVETLAFSGTLALDFYRPGRADTRPAPCVLVVHGGGWDSGDRTQLATFNHWLARRGYAVAAISYRLAPDFPWPAQRADALAAIAFLKMQASRLAIDASRFVLLGRSAGGQIAEAVGYTANDPAIRGVVALYAPSDLEFGYLNAHEDDMIKSPSLMRKFLGGTPATAHANYVSASAYFHVTKNTPPTLQLHGELDTLVWHRHSVRLDARLAEHGVPHAFVSLPWATHAFDYTLHGPGGQLTTFAVEWFLAVVTK